jgi:hypothetical protein
MIRVYNETGIKVYLRNRRSCTPIGNCDEFCKASHVGTLLARSMCVRLNGSAVFCRTRANGKRPDVSPWMPPNTPLSQIVPAAPLQPFLQFPFVFE